MKYSFQMIISLFFVIVLLVATSGIILGSQKKVEEKENRLGKEIYWRECKVCHGDKGDGMSLVRHVLNPSPKNFTHPMVIQNLKRDRMIDSVINGRPGTAMMPWENNLTRKEIEAVVDYIRSTFMTDINYEGTSSNKLINPSNTPDSTYP